MKAPLAKKVKSLFNSPKESQKLKKAIQALNENNTIVKTKIKDKNVMLLELR